MAQQSWTALANDVPPVAAITSNTFTGPQDITTGTTGTLGVPLTVPGNFFRVGQAWRFTAAGTYSVTGTPTLAFGIYVGTAAQAVSPTLTASSGVTTMNWQLNVAGTVRTIGASTVGTMLCSGLLQYQVSSNTAAPAFLPVQQAPLAVGTGFNTTIANALTVSATYGTSNASNIVVLHEWLVEYLN